MHSISSILLLSYITGLTLDKKHQLSDWRQRPLSKEMLIYARSDTMYLHYIYDRLRIDIWNTYESAGKLLAC